MEAQVFVRRDRSGSAVFYAEGRPDGELNAVRVLLASAAGKKAVILELENERGEFQPVEVLA